MGFVARMAAYWQCDACAWEWFLDSESGPRQCPKCGSRKWNDSIVRDAKLYEQALAVRHLNRHRRPLKRGTVNRRIRRNEVREKPLSILAEVPTRLPRCTSTFPTR